MFDIFKNAGHSLFLVGGAVRDKMLGIPPGDIDYATDASPGDVIDILSSTGIKVIPTGVRYGTVTAVYPQTHEKAEITTFRCAEVYRRGSRHPRVEFGSSIEEDLKRRDFTINAMAINAAGDLIDPYHGEEDLKKHLIDTPGSPDSAFLDDPLRILRAYRFAAKLGFSISDRVRRAARNFAVELSTISAQRKYREMTGLLAVDNGSSVVAALSMMKEDGVLIRVLPELEYLFVTDGLEQGRYHTGDVWHHTLEVIANVPSITVLRWAALLHDSAKGLVRVVDDNGEPHFCGHEIQGEQIASSVAERLQFSKIDRKALCTLIRNHMRPLLYDSQWGNSSVRRLMREAGDQLENLFLLAEADIRAHEPHYVETSLKKLEELRKRVGEQKRGRMLPAEIGQNLSAMGFEGPVIGRILRKLEDMAADGILPEPPTVDQCLSALWDNQSNVPEESKKD